MYRVRKKNIAKRPAAPTSISPFAASVVRERSRSRGISGSGERRSRSPAATASRSATARPPSVHADVHGCSSVRTTVSVKTRSAEVPSTAPRTSGAERSASRGPSAGTVRYTIGTTTSAIGTLMRNTQRQSNSLDERAAGEQAGRRPDAGERGPRAEGARPLAGLPERREQDGQRRRREEGAGKALHAASADQHPGARREAARRRGQGEGPERAHEHAPSPEQVRGLPADEQEAAEREEVRVGDPRQRALGEVEVLLDGRQRDVHDRVVHEQHELPEADEEEDLHAPVGERCG